MLQSLLKFLCHAFPITMESFYETMIQINTVLPEVVSIRYFAIMPRKILFKKLMLMSGNLLRKGTKVSITNQRNELNQIQKSNK